MEDGLLVAVVEHTLLVVGEHSLEVDSLATIQGERKRERGAGGRGEQRLNKTRSHIQHVQVYIPSVHATEYTHVHIHTCQVHWN